MMEQEKHDWATADDLAYSFVKRAKNDRDVVLAVTGYEGDGKSTFAVAEVIAILKQLGKTDEEILGRFNDYMIYSPNKDEMYKKITNPEKYTPINSDEAIKALYKLNWASESQKLLNTLFALCRKENKINILCMPRFTDFNEYFRNHRIMYWLLIVERGMGILMQKDWNPFTKDPWHMDENRKLIDEKMYRKKLIDFNTEEKINLLKKTKNFVSLVKWDDIPNKYKKVYLEGKNKFGYTELDQVEEGSKGKLTEKHISRIRATIKNLHAKGMSSEEIAAIMDTPVKTIANTIGTLKEVGEISPSPIPKRPLSINNTSSEDNF